MRVVERPEFRPQTCAVYPFLGAEAAVRGMRFVDTGAELPGFDNHVYLSETAVQEAAAVLGWPTAAEHAALGAELADALVKQQQLLDELAGLAAYRDAVDKIRDSVKEIRSHAQPKPADDAPSTSKPTRGSAT